MAPPYFNDLTGSDSLSVKIPSSTRPAPTVSQLQIGSKMADFTHVPSSEHWQPVSEASLAPLQYVLTTPFRSSHELKPFPRVSQSILETKLPLHNPKNLSCQWIYCTNMLNGLVAGCWKIRHRLKPSLCNQYIFSMWLFTSICRSEAEYSKLWVKQFGSEHLWSSVGGKMKPSSVHCFGFNTVKPWFSLNSHSTSNACKSGFGRILKVPFARLPSSKYSWHVAAKVWVPFKFS